MPPQGDDTLIGRGSNDALYADKIYLGDGDDRLRGGAGGDFLRSEVGRDSLFGGSGNDKIWAGGNWAVLEGIPLAQLSPDQFIFG